MTCCHVHVRLSKFHLGKNFYLSKHFWAFLQNMYPCSSNRHPILQLILMLQIPQMEVMLAVMNTIHIIIYSKPNNRKVTIFDNEQ